ncbi:MAG: type II toxin-antitoxin system RelE/ParE family toxin [Sulfurovum sp.]|nr:type II toxin-antitoxin system RelE/ParE family toxin [Sulfurovum sp.]
MSYTVIEQDLYLKALKKLSKKYKNIESDIENFLLSINSIKDLGVELKHNVYKVRIANSDKNKGKSAGYRLISYVKIVDNELHLIYIYDKSSLANISEKELDTLLIKQL